ncbi:hypothetical protein BLA29_011384 [Euroglyphus maynei]|uniref:Uncharacterized protein n=1 Tax=Euroglyphus maynei TaxID=6958 RepID=A0A1Y3BKU3_EURMA|nr:hypothetical protein BLA29_011384 [Euroglyphus maynei]
MDDHHVWLEQRL